MKKFLWLVLFLAASPLTRADGARTFVLAPAGDVAPGLAENVRVYLENNAEVTVKLAAPVPVAAGQDLDALGRAAAQALAESDFAVIVLAQPADDQPLDVSNPQERYAVLNLARLAAGPDDKSHLDRRAGQMGLRLMARQMGMTPCPFPLCVLVEFDQVGDLDGMSGNFCPPCRDRFLRLARKAGVALAGDAAVEPAPLELPAPE